jgi:anti-sigma B factor antagonist
MVPLQPREELLLPIEVVSMSDEVLAVLVRGDIDLVESGELRAVLADAAEGRHATILVDLSGVRFMGSSGMGVLARFARDLEQRGRCLQVLGCPPRLFRAFQVTGLDQVLDITVA